VCRSGKAALRAAASKPNCKNKILSCCLADEHRSSLAGVGRHDASVLVDMVVNGMGVMRNLSPMHKE
jgi:hypothetical protein